MEDKFALRSMHMEWRSVMLHYVPNVDLQAYIVEALIHRFGRMPSLTSGSDEFKVNLEVLAYCHISWLGKHCSQIGFISAFGN